MAYSRTNVVLPLFLVLIIDAMGFGLVFPLIGSLILNTTGDLLPVGLSQHMRELWYGISVGSFFIAALFGSPFFGALSDRWGRKKVLLICLKGTALAYIVSYFGILEHSMTLFVVGRVFAGFLAGSQSIAQAAIIDISAPEKKTVNLAMITLASSLGWCIGPLVGGIFSSSDIIGTFSMTTPFLISALLALINFVWLWIGFQETHVVKEKKPLPLMKAFTLLADAVKRKVVRFYMVLFLIQQVSFGFYYQHTALKMIETFDYTPLKLGIYNTYMGTLFTFTLLVVIRVALRFANTKTITMISFITLGLTLLANLFYSSELSYWTLLPSIIVCVGLSYACMISLFSDAVNQDEQGWVMGVSEAVGAVSWSMAAAFVGLISWFSINLITYALTTLLLLLSFCFWRYRPQPAP